MKHLPVIFERLESTLTFVVFVWLYALGNHSWLLFLVLLFTIDISMVGYLVNNRVGAVVYNIGHSYATTILIGAVAIFWVAGLAPFVLIWFAHIAMDRALGYGLKLSTSFNDTHLGKIGKTKN